MPTSIEKFRKLLAAYEDEVQRKQHKMGKKVDPRDLVEPNWTTAVCSFRRGNQVVWSPSFEEIGVFTPQNGGWLWGWADPHVDPKLKTRVEDVRKQGQEWGIDLMTTGVLTLENGEAQAWELATVATAVSRADAMYRVVEPDHVRFLALFEGPPATRSSVSMRAVRPDGQLPAVQIPPSRLPSGTMSAVRTTNAALQRQGTNPALQRQATNPALQRQGTNPALQRQATNPAIGSGNEREPSAQTRAELGQRLFEAIPWAQQGQLGSVNLLARAMPPSGPVGSVSLDLRVTLKPSNGGPELTLAPTAALNDALVSLWMRCRDREGAPYRFATVRLENGPHGMQTNVVLEW